MAIDDPLYQKLLARFEQMPNKLRCPACSDHHWQLRSMEDTFGSSGDAGKIPAIVTIMCLCCGHLSFFDSKALGLTQ
jgi:hypothetical protein